MRINMTTWINDDKSLDIESRMNCVYCALTTGMQDSRIDDGNTG